MAYTKINYRDPQVFEQLVQALAMRESGNNPNAVGPVITAGANAGDQARGRLQVMPKTAMQPGYGVAPASNPNDPNELERVGRDYLAAMLEANGGELEPALVAYNAGPGNVDKFRAGGFSALPQAGQTQPYVEDILANYTGGTDVTGGTELTAGAGDLSGEGVVDPEAVAAAAGPDAGEVMSQVLSGPGAIPVNPANPTVSADRFGSRIEANRARQQQIDSVFSSNAPASWLNMLASVGNQAEGLFQEYKQDQAKNEQGAKIAELLAGDMSPEKIAEITALDPEMGRQLQLQQAALQRERESQAAQDARLQTKIGADASLEAQKAAREEALIRQRGEEARKTEEFKAGMADSRTQIQKDLQAMGLEPGTPAFNEAYKAKMFKDNGTTLERNAEAAGYIPGTPEYQEFIQKQLDANSSPDVVAAQIAADAAARDADKMAGTMGTAAGELAMGLTKSANASASQLPQWTIARKAMEDFNSGRLAPTGKAVGSFLSSLGVTDEDLKNLSPEVYGAFEAMSANPGAAASMEIVERIVNEAIIDKIGSGGSEGGFPANNFSNADLQFLKTSVPGLDNTEGGMRAKLAFLEWRDKATIAKSDAWLQYREQLGGPPTSIDWDKFEKQWREAPANKDLQDAFTAAVEMDRGASVGATEPTVDDLLEKYK